MTQPTLTPVMPAQAGIHDFLLQVEVRKSGLIAVEKSWMPACAGMTVVARP
jgi:hypothetical protein